MIMVGGASALVKPEPPTANLTEATIEEGTMNDNLPELLTIEQAIEETIRVTGCTRDMAIKKLAMAINNNELGLYEKANVKHNRR